MPKTTTVGLAFLGAVDAVESEALRAFVVQDLDRIAVENFGDDAGEISDNGSANEP